MFTDKLFTGQREITGLGIYHYGARFYSPKLGRFLSADTIVPSFANPQSLNRYSYVINNPLLYVDPTGHMPVDDECGYMGQECGDSVFNPSNTVGSGGGNGGGGGGGGSNYCTTHPGACGTPPTTPEAPTSPVVTTTPTPTDPIPAAGGANDYSCFNNPSACGGGNQTQPSSQSFFTTPGYSVPEFVGGAILFAGGLGLAGFGVALAFIALGEVIVAAPTGPGELLVVPHALAMTAVGGAFFLGGLGTAYVGFSAMRDAVTP